MGGGLSASGPQWSGADVLGGAPDRGALAILELGGEGRGDLMRVRACRVLFGAAGFEHAEGGQRAGVVAVGEVRAPVPMMFFCMCVP
jgi:hypothetical protein